MLKLSLQRLKESLDKIITMLISILVVLLLAIISGDYFKYKNFKAVDEIYFNSINKANWGILKHVSKVATYITINIVEISSLIIFTLVLFLALDVFKDLTVLQYTRLKKK